MNQQAQLRQELLLFLYNDRLTDPMEEPYNGWVSLHDIKQTVGNCKVAIGVLVELKFIIKDGPKLRITGQGVIACEQGLRG